MFKTTNLKKWLTACCCLLIVVSFAQTTGNPYWSLPPNYIPTNPVPHVTSSILSLPTGSGSNQYPNVINPVLANTGSGIPSYNNFASTTEDLVGPHNM